MGYPVFIVSNQPDISRGHIQKGTTEKINQIIKNEYPIKDISVCPHDDHHNCNCRKPKPGMILDLCKKYDIDPEKSYLVGDSWKDISAGKAAGCKTILLQKEYNQQVKADYFIEKFELIIDIIKKTTKKIEGEKQTEIR